MEGQTEHECGAEPRPDSTTIPQARQSLKVTQSTVLALLCEGLNVFAAGRPHCWGCRLVLWQGAVRAAELVAAHAAENEDEALSWFTVHLKRENGANCCPGDPPAYCCFGVVHRQAQRALPSGALRSDGITTAATRPDGHWPLWHLAPSHYEAPVVSSANWCFVHCRGALSPELA